jgi:hypothetical protein
MGAGFGLHEVAGRSPHVYAVRGDGGVVACLEWRPVTCHRRCTGWYLTRLDARGGEQRLFVDVALEQLAGDTQRAALQWDDDADSAAALSAPLALARARAALQDRTRAPGPGAVSGAGLAP